VFEPLHDPPDHDGDHAVFLVRDSSVLVTVEDDRARPLWSDEAVALVGAAPELVLGRLGDVVYWAAELPEHVEPTDPHRLAGLRSLHGVLSEPEWNIGGRATQLWQWHRDNRFCGRCGGPMTRAAGERAMRCPVDGTCAYPRLSPAVIVLVEDGEGRALLGRNGRFDIPMYSTLAGFVEPGESLEDTVRREIREEAGIEVDDIRYFGSQPWPFPNSLMLGFVARWSGGEVVVDGEEIVDAQWFRPDDLPMIPPPLSIARRLIDDWVRRTT
jgi:NAD+ diphosphatase